MQRLRKFVIPFTGLKDGKHNFEFDIDDRFFEQYESSEIQKGTVSVQVGVIKTPRFIELEFDISGTVHIMCDRCLDYFDLGTRYTGKLYFRFGEETYEQTEDVIILSSRETEICIDQYIYEFLHLTLPYKKIHPEIAGKSGCNIQMVNKLKSLSVQQVKENDPRWDQLKKIKDKN